MNQTQRGVEVVGFGARFRLRLPTIVWQTAPPDRPPILHFRHGAADMPRELLVLPRTQEDIELDPNARSVRIGLRGAAASLLDAVPGFDSLEKVVDADAYPSPDHGSIHVNGHGFEWPRDYYLSLLVPDGDTPAM